MQTTTKEYQYTERADRTIVVKANGGRVELQAKVGTDWVITDTISADGALVFYPDRNRFRVVPFDGAAYELLER